MGCLGSKGMPTNEARKNHNDSKENLSKKNESSIKKLTNNDNLITDNNTLKRNNDTKEEENKDKKEKKINDIKVIDERINKNKESNYIEKKSEKEEKQNKKQGINGIKDEEEVGINLVFNAKSEGRFSILGDKFIENNRDNIELIVNNKQKELKQFHELKKEIILLQY